MMRDLRFAATVPGGRPVAAYALGLAFAFAISAMFLSRDGQAKPVSKAADNSESGK